MPFRSEASQLMSKEAVLLASGVQWEVPPAAHVQRVLTAKQDHRLAPGVQPDFGTIGVVLVPRRTASLAPQALGAARKALCLEMLAWSAPVAAIAIAQGLAPWCSATAALVERGVMWRVPRKEVFVKNALLANGAHRSQLSPRQCVLPALWVASMSKLAPQILEHVSFVPRARGA